MFIKYFNFLLISAGSFLMPFFGFGATTFDNPLGEDTTLAGLLSKILNYLISDIAPLIATIMAIYVAFLYMTSGGVPEKVQKAHKTLTWLIIGITVLLLAQGIIYTIQKTLDL